MDSESETTTAASTSQTKPEKPSAWQAIYTFLKSSITYIRELYVCFQNWLIHFSAGNLGPVLVITTIIMVCFVVYTAIKPHQWIFSVQAQSRIVELVSPADKETRWRVNNAILCVRGPLELPGNKFTPIAPDNPVCGGKRWSGYHIKEQEQALVLTGAINAVLELRGNNTLFLALRMHHPVTRNQTTDALAAAESDEANSLLPGASLSFTDGSPDISLVQNGKLHINIIFPAAEGNALAERIFPFTAVTTIGRDINWTGTSLLTSGDIEVYTADNSPDKRKLVDTAKLLLGDQLRLYPLDRENTIIYPKGFIRLEPGKDYFDVIAFGAADYVRIERFGDNGYDFKPGLLLLLFNDQVLILTLSIFVALVTFLTAVAGVCGKKDCK